MKCQPNYNSYLVLVPGTSTMYVPVVFMRFAYCRPYIYLMAIHTLRVLLPNLKRETNGRRKNVSPKKQGANAQTSTSNVDVEG